MSVTDVTNKIEYAGDDATTAFAFTFKIFAETDLKVFLDDTVLTISTHYTVAINTTSEGGTVTMITPPATGEDLLIKRNMDFQQDSDIPTESNFPEETLENMIDKSRMLDIDQKELIGRMLRFKETTDVAADRTLPEAVENKGLRWDANGNLVNTTDDINDQIATVAASAAAALASENAAAASAAAALASENAAAASAAAALASENAAAASAAAAAGALDPEKITKTYTDFSAASLASSITLQSLPAKNMIYNLVLIVNTAFVGTGITGLFISVGITGNTDKYFFEFDATQAANSLDLGNVLGMESVTAATDLKITARAVGANLDQLTAGQIEVQYQQRALVA